VVYSIEHEEFSDGSSPLQDEVNKKKGIITNVQLDAEQQKVLGDGWANKIAQQTSGKAYNMGQGQKLKSFESFYPLFATS